MITDKEIIRFQELYQRCFGKEISKEDAYEKGVKLLRLVSLVYRPMSETEHQKLQARRQETGDL